MRKFFLSKFVISSIKFFCLFFIISCNKNSDSYQLFDSKGEIESGKVQNDKDNFSAIGENANNTNKDEVKIVKDMAEFVENINLETLKKVGTLEHIKPNGQII